MTDAPDGEQSPRRQQFDSDKVADALRKTGFLLEQDVYSCMRKRGHNTFLSSLYLDRQQGKFREMDVTTRDHQQLWGKPTSLSHISFWRSMTIECKNYDAPLVVIGRSRAETRMIRTFSEFAASREVPSSEGSGQKTSLGVALKVRSLPASPEQATFIGSQVVRLEHKSGGYGATNSGLMESLFLPVAKAMWSEQRELSRNGDSSESSSSPMHVVLSFPIIVTSKPVLEADVTAGSPVIREVPWTTVLRKFHRKTEDDDILPESILLDIVSSDGLVEYLDKRAEAFTQQVCRVLENNTELWMPTSL